MVTLVDVKCNGSITSWLSCDGTKNDLTLKYLFTFVCSPVKSVETVSNTGLCYFSSLAFIWVARPNLSYIFVGFLWIINFNRLFSVGNRNALGYFYWNLKNDQHEMLVHCRHGAERKRTNNTNNNTNCGR